MSKMTKCDACGNEISSSAASCPQCGEPRKKKTALWKKLLIALFVLAIIGAVFEKEPVKESSNNQQLTGGEVTPTNATSDNSQELVSDAQQMLVPDDLVGTWECQDGYGFSFDNSNNFRSSSRGYKYLANPAVTSPQVQTLVLIGNFDLRDNKLLMVHKEDFWYRPDVNETLRLMGEKQGWNNHISSDYSASVYLVRNVSQNQLELKTDLFFMGSDSDPIKPSNPETHICKRLD